MLTKLHVRNFKRCAAIEFDLERSVVLIGPNNSGKTTALQALALWELGLRRWTEKQGGISRASQRTVSRPFPPPVGGEIAMKRINRARDEVLKNYAVPQQ